jgi:sec-independent protein translocase protein TatC
MSDVTTELETGANQTEPESETGKMSFLEHLDELRKRLLHIAVYISVGFIAGWVFREQIFHFVAIPVTKLGIKLIFFDLLVPFTLYMKVAFLAGIFLTLPLTLYEVWKFIAPGLYRKEKKYAIPFLFFSVVLFVLGAGFCYYIILPAACKFLIQFGSDFTPQIRADGYFDMANMMLLGFGLIFEMPVIVAFLAIFGLASAGFLWRNFKYAIVIIVILAAVISPTSDVINLMLWSAPMILLYIISIGVAFIFGRSRKAKGLS